MAVSFILLILIALFVFGVIATVVALVALAIAKGRGGAALVVGGLAFVGLLIGAALLSLFVGYSTVREQSSSIASFENAKFGTVDWQPGGEPTVPPLNLTTDYSTWAIGLTPMVFVVLGVGALMAFAARRGHAHAAASGHHRSWLFGLAAVAIGFLFFGGIRYQLSTGPSASAARARAVEQVRKVGLQLQQQANAGRAAASGKNAKQLAENVDIHELMDKVDKPRIALETPLSPTTASAELIAAATAPEGEAAAVAPAEPESKPTSAGAAKSRPSSKQKHLNKATVTSPEKSAGSGSKVAAEAALSAAADAATASDKSTSDAQKAVAAVRPAWVDSLPVRTRDLRREVIVTEEYESMDECFRAADVYLMLKTYERLQQLIGRPHATQNLPSIVFHNNIMMADGQIIYVTDKPSDWSDSRLSVLSRMGVTPEFLRGEIVSKDAANGELHEYMETSTRSFGPMKRLHTQIEFTPTIDRELMRLWDAQIREDRFAYVGAGAGSVLGLLGMVWGLLKIDTATKGYYSKRLFIGVPVAIIGVTLLLMLASIG